jgi:hypothetical protein
MSKGFSSTIVMIYTKSLESGHKPPSSGSLCIERHHTSQLCTWTATANLDSRKCQSLLDNTTHHAPLPDQYVGQHPPSTSFICKTEIAMYAEKLEELQNTKRLNPESKKLYLLLGSKNECKCLCSLVT